MKLKRNILLKDNKLKYCDDVAYIRCESQNKIKSIFATY